MKVCTCRGSCKGPEGLADGYTCALSDEYKRYLDINEWRRGVALVYSAIGEPNPPGLCCATLAEKVLAIRADNEQLRELLEHRERTIHTQDLQSRELDREALEWVAVRDRLMRRVAELEEIGQRLLVAWNNGSLAVEESVRPSVIQAFNDLKDSMVFPRLKLNENR